jgi:protein involved in polysaccharide export with SLBB domain
MILAAAMLVTFGGCTSIMTPISGVPAHRLPPQFLAEPKNNLIPVDVARLRQDAPREYLVDAEDILGIYIEGVLGSGDEPPPVHMPDRFSDLPPSIGFPIPVREDGTLALPLVDPIPVRGLSLAQVENAIRRAYTIDNRILQPGKDRIIVTLMQQRTYRVVVMRQDGVGQQQIGSQVAGSGQTTRGISIDLPAYKNDVLHALAETGGLPGVDAQNEIKILKGNRMDARQRDAFVREFYAQPLCDPCLCRPPLPEDPAIVRIPLRLPPGEVPTFQPNDIILEDGDIVLIEGREREVFYTGGRLPGGEFPLPRDYDLDVLGALAVVGQGVAAPGQASAGRGFGGISSSSLGGASPSQLFILRKTPCDGQVTIAVDLNRAINDPRARPLVQAGDTLILQYKPEEEILNFGLGTFFTFGIRELFRSR